MLFEIGEESILSSNPIEITFHERPYILTKDKNGKPILYSAICPHLHGTVEPTSNEIWKCPQHLWTFNPENGRSINSPSSYLQSYSIMIKNGKLFADLPASNEKLTDHKSGNQSKGPKITLISNACMLIEWRGFNLLTDPWIEGPAIFGSWIQYPPFEIKVSELPKIDAIWISHEHSDHLHPNTLSKFDKNIPVYVPKIENERLAKLVKKIGFKDVISMSSFKPFNITKTIEAVSFKSASIWNDSILFLRTGDFKILNFNDAGINLNIKNFVDEVDMICSSFSQSASAYPTNWTHLDDMTKNRLMDDRNSGMLKMLKQMVDMFHAKFLLPIASFNALYYPEHLKYEKMKKRNSLLDILNYFKNDNVKVLDLIPGESWNSDNNTINRRDDRNKFFNEQFRFNYLQESFRQDKDKKFIPTKFDIVHNDLKDYFISFNKSELLKYIGHMNLCLKTYDEKRTLYSLIEFQHEKISYKELDKEQKSNLMISCPGGIVQEIIQNDLSWDESFYWCDFKRDSDVYNLAFWRLLHAPWKARLKNTDSELFSGPLSEISIATLIEKGGEDIVSLLENYGLYCSGCPPSVGENLHDGCSIHGIPEETMNEIIGKIQKLKIVPNS